MYKLSHQAVALYLCMHHYVNARHDCRS